MMRVIVWRRSRTQSCFWRAIKLLVVMALLVVLVVPIRNIIFHFALPGMWMEHNSLFLLKVLIDHQNFPVEDTPIGPSPIKLTVDFNDIRTKFTKQGRTFSAFYERQHHLERMSKSDLQAQAELEQLSKFEPLMSQHDRAIALFTLDVFARACNAANLTYFLISGSILGAVRHHGMIPWDDDIDIVMNGSEWVKIRNVLGNIPGFQLFTPGKVQWKFFMTSLPQGNRPFKWPNVDIFFFSEDQNYIWAQTWGAKGSLCSKKSDIFPLIRRKFEMLDMPVPRVSSLLVSAEFGDYRSACKTGSYIHKTNRVYPPESLGSVDCQKLYDVFPFVFHESTSQGTILEVCKVAGRTVDNVTLPAGA